MKILVIGDIIGRPGRNAVKKAIKELKKEDEIDLVIANGENLAHGSGMTLKTYTEMLECGVDFFTSGNHILKRPEIFSEMEKKNCKIIRPANFPPGNPGIGYQIVNIDKKKILIINLNGRVFMSHDYDCPFRIIDQILNDHKKDKFDSILVDFHAEATSEKIAMKHYLNGRVSALWGTHTHVPTADTEITDKGLAYITDVGMTGPTDSVIGVKKENIIESFLKQINFKLDVAEGRCIFNGIVLELIGRSTSKSIRQVQMYID
jgi:2',3'-cyclic-nucleotide 2'-phosphodiesterase